MTEELVTLTLRLNDAESLADLERRLGGGPCPWCERPIGTIHADHGCCLPRIVDAARGAIIAHRSERRAK